MGSLEEPNEDTKATLRRFAGAFDLAFTRYEDLKRAEADAREANIEASLERARARTMAMQHSAELQDTSRVFCDQLSEISENFTGVYFALVNKENSTVEIWHASSASHRRGRSTSRPMIDSLYNDLPYWPDWLAAWERSDDDISFHITPELYATWMSAYPNLTHELEVDIDAIEAHYDNGWFQTDAMTKYGSVGATTAVAPFTDSEKAILVRFAKEFERTYARFLDLQKAESAAREAQIEAALERVRAAAMAMHHSEEISEVARVLCEQLHVLDFPDLIRAMISTGDDDPDYIRWYLSSRRAETSYPVVRTPIEDFLPIMGTSRSDWEWPEKRRTLKWKGTDLQESIRVFRDAGWRPDESDFAGPVDRLVDNQSGFPGGAIHISTKEVLDEEFLQVQDRFAGVFGMAYRRFEDLMSAESRAIDARREASLDRIRGEISTMRTVEDLERITPLMWQELKMLEIPFLRCGLLIADEKAQLVRFYPSHPDGRTLAAIVLPFGGAGIGDEALEAWRNHQVWKDVWDRDRFVQWTADMVAAGQIENPEDYYDGSEPPESIALQFVPFAQGMIYVGSPEPLEDAQVEVVQSLADAFAVAYARYDDFRTTEKALTELKATQKQLVEQEKLASLGSLTAGIAHEIKNPLNFVNNFAEVNSELVDELNGAVASGNTDEVTSILKDLRGNTVQIAKHGKRADSIVRSMMQHAKGGTSEMESVDLNEFIEEYVNLAWHGMRAREHGFEAEVIRDYDESAGSLDLKPQDIGRVVLNILNNAFQSVSKAGITQPIVTVSTKRASDSVEIHISDNGPGIPEDIREKIFEPFFTTKETGEGTGLGLSLSHDIVTKGHQGTMTASNRPEGGAVFTITLPIE